MLSGIKVGKKKAKKPTSVPGTKNDVTAVTPTFETSSARHAADDANSRAAALLKQNLLSGGTVGTAGTSSSAAAARMVQDRPILLPDKPLEEWTVAELAAAEKLTSTAESHQETTSNIMRHYKHTNKRRRYVDSDDEEQDELRAIQVNASVKKGKEDPNLRRQEQRHQNNALRQNQQLSAALSKSWWWLESSQFNSHQLLARTQHLTLVWAPPPPWATSQENLPCHFFLVPLEPATSFRVCEAETVMKQVHWFHKTLQQTVYPNHVVLVTETVLPGGKSSYWQAKLDVWIVPAALAMDVTLFLRQELAQHGYEPHCLIRGKPLHRSVPPKFPYLYIQYEPTIGKSAVQPLDTTSKISPYFWSDLLAGAVRDGDNAPGKNKNSLSKEAELAQIQAFQKAWNAVDKTEIL